MRSRLRITRAVFSATATLAAFAPARAAGFRFRLATSDAKDAPQTLALIQMAEAVKRETNGRLQIEIFSDGSLGSMTSTLTQIRLGSLELMSNANALLAAVSPVIQAFSIGFSFSSSGQALAALDGPLGDYVRRDLAAKGIYVFDRSQESGFREITTSTKPIQSADDFVGLKIRTQPAPIYVDLFKAFGASPVPIDPNELYTSLQTRIVDAQENPLVAIEGFRIYEVQRYLSMTNHLWAGETLIANPSAISALPSDLQATLKRNVAKAVMNERRGIRAQQASLLDKLRRQGLNVNTPDRVSMRARLGSYYTRWKNELGNTVWGLLEEAAGKLS